MWGLFGFMAAAPRSEPVMQATVLPEDSAGVVPGTTANAAIPVTGEAPSAAGILSIYGLFGLGALLLILALLTVANKKTVPVERRKEPSDES